MHPQFIAVATAEHVKDMQAEPTPGRRGRESRRARRGANTRTAAAHRNRNRPADQEPWPWLSYPPLYSRAA